jgi:hypothetical protein
MTEHRSRAARRIYSLAAAAVMLIATVTYLPTIEWSFLQDDFVATGQFFTDDGSFHLPRQPDLGFPTDFVPFWTHLADSYFWGDNAFGHHLTNLLLHVLASTAVFVLIRRLMRGRLAVAFFSALFFALCPLHLNAVGWISGRTLPLATVFLLVGTLGSLQRQTAPLLITSCYVGGLLCHPAAFFMPLIVLFFDVLQRRPDWRSRLASVHLPMLVIMAGYFVLLRSMGVRIWRTDDTLAVLQTSTLMDTLGRLMVPLNESITNPDKAPFVKWTVLAVLLPLQVIVLIFRRAAPPPVFWIGLVWFLLMVAPILSSAQLSADLADSRLFYGVMPPLYLMLASLFFADTVVFREPTRSRTDRQTLTRAVAFGVIFCAVLGVCMFKNDQAYAGAGNLVRHVQRSAIDAARGTTEETRICIMDPPVAYAGAPVFARGLTEALSPPHRRDPKHPQIFVVRSEDTEPLIKELAGDGEKRTKRIVVMWMNPYGLRPERPFQVISPVFPPPDQPDEPFRAPRFAGEDFAAWRTKNGLVGTTDASGFKGSAGTDDPWLVSPPMVIPSSWIKEVQVRMSIKSTAAPLVPIDLFWARLEDPNAFSSDRQSRRVIAGDGALHELVFPLTIGEGEDPDRPENYLTRLRLDPARSDEIHIESITLVTGAAAPGREQLAIEWNKHALTKWRAGSDTTARLDQEDLRVETEGEDPMVLSPLIDLKGEEVRLVEVVMRVDSDQSDGQCFWATDDPTDFNETRSCRFKVHAGDGRFHHYFIYLKGPYRIPRGSRLKALRIDPMAGPGTAWIRSVKVFKIGE